MPLPASRDHDGSHRRTKWWLGVCLHCWAVNYFKATVVVLLLPNKETELGRVAVEDVKE